MYFVVLSTNMTLRLVSADSPLVDLTIPVPPVGPVTVDAAPVAPFGPVDPLSPVGPAIAGRVEPVTRRSPVIVS